MQAEARRRLEDELDRVRGQWKCLRCAQVNERHSEDCRFCANRSPTPGVSSGVGHSGPIPASTTTLPPPTPPTARQISYIRVLAGCQGVTVPQQVFEDKAAATLWLDQHAGQGGR